jgi:hypothetical protein
VEGIATQDLQLLLERNPDQESRGDLCFVGRHLRYKNYIRLRLCNARPTLRNILQNPSFQNYIIRSGTPKALL